MHIEKGLSLGYVQDIFLNVILSCTLWNASHLHKQIMLAFWSLRLIDARVGMSDVSDTHSIYRNFQSLLIYGQDMVRLQLRSVIGPCTIMMA